jgi:tetratricopeptide (TPR) repeat protein
MKFLLGFLILLATHVESQTLLKFNKRFVECEDRWVAFQMNKDSLYNYGFIYIDEQAGLTLNYEGNFTITETGAFIPKKLDSTNVKYRLEANQVLVAIIPEDKFKELQIQPIPNWLKYYKTDTASVERLYRWGFLYNGWDQCAKALGYLERAQKINPKFKGLAVELAFSYNCLGQYDKAIEVLTAAINGNPGNAYFYKELIYAQVKSGNLELASETCKKAILVCTDKTYNGEDCYNLLHAFYLKKDKKNFDLWVEETKKWGSSNTKIVSSIKNMQEELAK